MVDLARWLDAVDQWYSNDIAGLIETVIGCADKNDLETGKSRCDFCYDKPMSSKDLCPFRTAEMMVDPADSNATESEPSLFERISATLCGLCCICNKENQVTPEATVQVPMQPRVSSRPGTPHHGRTPESPGTSPTSASPETTTTPGSSETATTPASPGTATTPASPGKLPTTSGTGEERPAEDDGEAPKAQSPTEAELGIYEDTSSLSEQEKKQAKFGAKKGKAVDLPSDRSSPNSRPGTSGVIPIRTGNAASYSNQSEDDNTSTAPHHSDLFGTIPTINDDIIFSEDFDYWRDIIAERDPYGFRFY